SIYPAGIRCAQYRVDLTAMHANSAELITSFFFSSRRRHTRSKRDWSSDVCSSDLVRGQPHHPADPRQPRRPAPGRGRRRQDGDRDRKSTRLNSSHVSISYAVFCLKKKKNIPCKNAWPHVSNEISQLAAKRAVRER